MVGPVDRRVDGQMDERVEEWVDGQMDGRMDEWMKSALRVLKDLFPLKTLGYLVYLNDHFNF